MEIHLPPSKQHRLAELAAHRGCDADTLVQEAISWYLDEEGLFTEAVTRGEEALERGEYLTHEQVEKRVERLLQS